MVWKKGNPESVALPTKIKKYIANYKTGDIIIPHKIATDLDLSHEDVLRGLKELVKQDDVEQNTTPQLYCDERSLSDAQLEKSLHDLKELNPKAVLYDDLRGAYIGYASQQNVMHVACYDYNLIIEHLVRSGMDEIEAIEYFEYNIQNNWIGKNTPVILYSE